MKTDPRSRWLEMVRAERRRRQQGDVDPEAALNQLLEELRQMAERMAATGHLAPPAARADRSPAERLAAALYLDMPDDERERELEEIEKILTAGAPGFAQ